MKDNYALLNDWKSVDEKRRHVLKEPFNIYCNLRK
jgi:hypothetical protein